MSTIHQRCFALYKQQKIDKIPGHDQMLAVGKIVLDKFREITDGKWPIRVPAPANMGQYTVRYYPSFFTPEIDTSILHLVCGKKEKVKRKKLTV